MGPTAGGQEIDERRLWRRPSRKVLSGTEEVLLRHRHMSPVAAWTVEGAAERTLTQILLGRRGLCGRQKPTRCRHSDRGTDNGRT
jgi:hypothetical protein